MVAPSQWLRPTAAAPAAALNMVRSRSWGRKKDKEEVQKNEERQPTKESVQSILRTSSLRRRGSLRSKGSLRRKKTSDEDEAEEEEERETDSLSRKKTKDELDVDGSSAVPSKSSTSTEPSMLGKWQRKWRLHKEKETEGDNRENTDNRGNKLSAPPFLRTRSWRLRKSKGEGHVDDEAKAGSTAEQSEQDGRRKRKSKRKTSGRVIPVDDSNNEEKDKQRHKAARSAPSHEVGQEAQFDDERDASHEDIRRRRRNNAVPQNVDPENMILQIKELSMRANEHYVTKEYKLALEDYDKILSLIRSSSKRQSFYLKLTADVLLRKARVHESMDELPTAMDLYFDAVKLYQFCRKRNIRRDQKNGTDGYSRSTEKINQKLSMVLVNMANVQMKMGHFDFALELNEDAFQILRDIRVRNESKSEANLSATDSEDDFELLNNSISLLGLETIEKILYLRGNQEAAMEAHAESIRFASKISEQYGGAKDDGGNESSKGPDPHDLKNVTISIDSEGKSSNDSSGSKAIDRLLALVADEVSSKNASEVETTTSSMFGDGSFDVGNCNTDVYCNVPSLREAFAQFFAALTCENIKEVGTDMAGKGCGCVRSHDDQSSEGNTLVRDNTFDEIYAFSYSSDSLSSETDDSREGSFSSDGSVELLDFDNTPR